MMDEENHPDAGKTKSRVRWLKAELLREKLIIDSADMETLKYLQYISCYLMEIESFSHSDPFERKRYWPLANLFALDAWAQEWTDKNQAQGLQLYIDTLLSLTRLAPLTPTPFHAHFFITRFACCLYRLGKGEAAHELIDREVFSRNPFYPPALALKTVGFITGNQADSAAFYQSRLDSVCGDRASVFINSARRCLGMEPANPSQSEIGSSGQYIE